MRIGAGRDNFGGRLVMFTLGALFGYFVVEAVRTGKVKPSRHDRVYLRAEDPGTFWFHVFVFSVVACACFAAAVFW